MSASPENQVLLDRVPFGEFLQRAGYTRTTVTGNIWLYEKEEATRRGRNYSVCAIGFDGLVAQSKAADQEEAVSAVREKYHKRRLRANTMHPSNDGYVAKRQAEVLKRIGQYETVQLAETEDPGVIYSETIK